jgi:hypothetical protein
MYYLVIDYRCYGWSIAQINIVASIKATILTLKLPINSDKFHSKNSSIENFIVLKDVLEAIMFRFSSQTQETKTKSMIYQWI